MDATDLSLVIDKETKGIANCVVSVVVKDAEVKVAEATLLAERLLGEAESKRSELMLELAEMRRLRTRLSSELRQALRRYEELIDSFEEADRASSEAVAPDPAIQTALRR